MAVILKYVQHPRHLREYEHPGVLLPEFGQQLVKYGELAAVIDEMFVRRVRGARLRAVEQVRVVAALAQLHQDVLQPHLLHLAGAVHCW